VRISLQHWGGLHPGYLLKNSQAYPMIDDPIVEEVRRIHKEHAEQSGNDL